MPSELIYVKACRFRARLPTRIEACRRDMDNKDYGKNLIRKLILEGWLPIVKLKRHVECLHAWPFRLEWLKTN